MNRNLLRAWLVLLAALVLMPQVQGLSRIDIKSQGGAAILYDTANGKRFRPVGVNYTKIEDGYVHILFTPEYYDATLLTGALDTCQQYGYNTIRVFHCTYNGANGAPSGVGGALNSNVAVSSAYMNNFIDFLELANARGIYVTQAFEGIPFTDFYNDLRNAISDDTNFEDRNRAWGTVREIEARKAMAAGVMQYIKDNAPGMLPTMLVTSINNETRAIAKYKPFTMTSGSVVAPNGNSYSMNNDSQRQALYDDSMVYWADTIGDAIKAVDPSALVMVGMGTYWGATGDNPGLPVPNGIREESAYYNNHPALPAPLMNSNANGYDIVDVHLYPWSTRSTEFRLNASNIDQCNLNNGKVLLLGELGALFDKGYDMDNASHVATEFHERRRECYSLGFQGALWWAMNDYGGSDSNRVWKGTDDYREILARLNPAQQWPLAWPLSNLTLNETFDDGNSNGWTSASGWSIEELALVQNDASITHAIGYDGATYGNMTLQADVLLLKNANWAGLQFRKNASIDLPWESGYTAFVRSNGNVVLYKPGQVIQETASGFATYGNMNTLKVVTSGSSIKVYVNGFLKIDTNDSSYNVPGRVGLTTSKTKARFDNIRLK